MRCLCSLGDVYLMYSSILPNVLDLESSSISYVNPVLAIV
jgi:hypothetical protein